MGIKIMRVVGLRQTLIDGDFVTGRNTTHLQTDPQCVVVLVGLHTVNNNDKINNQIILHAPSHINRTISHASSVNDWLYQPNFQKTS